MIAPAIGGGGKSELLRAECLVIRGIFRVHPAFDGIHPEGTESATEKRPAIWLRVKRWCKRPPFPVVTRVWANPT
jgi:hypothetical protein